MPIHDFRCADCGEVFEALVRGSSTPTCPKCSSAKLDKLVSAPAPPAWSKAAVGRARQQARAEGHFSNYRKGER